MKQNAKKRNVKSVVAALIILVILTSGCGNPEKRTITTIINSTTTTPEPNTSTTSTTTTVIPKVTEKELCETAIKINNNQELKELQQNVINTNTKYTVKEATTHAQKIRELAYRPLFNSAAGEGLMTRNEADELTTTAYETMKLNLTHRPQTPEYQQLALEIATQIQKLYDYCGEKQQTACNDIQTLVSLQELMRKQQIYYTGIPDIYPPVNPEQEQNTNTEIVKLIETETPEYITTLKTLKDNAAYLDGILTQTNKIHFESKTDEEVKTKIDELRKKENTKPEKLYSQILSEIETLKTRLAKDCER